MAIKQCSPISLILVWSWNNVQRYVQAHAGHLYLTAPYKDGATPLIILGKA